MILIDTNVISELWKAEPNPAVLAWIDAQAIETLYLSAISLAELRLGIATMPKGKRRSTYERRLEGEVLPAFAGRVVAFDVQTTDAYADLMARAMAEGKGIGKADGYIASTAAAHGLTVATRDGDFAFTGIRTINPWLAVP